MTPNCAAESSAKRRRPAEVRELLLGAAERVVVQRGTAANAFEIAIEAGVHRSVLYRHFGTAEELLRQAALRPFHEFLNRIKVMTDRSSPAEPTPLWDLMVGFLGDLLDVLDEHRDFLVMAMSESSPLDDVERQTLRDELNRILSDIDGLARLEGGPRGLDTRTAPVHTRLTISMVLGVSSYGSWLLPERTGIERRSQLIDEMANFVLNGARQAPDDGPRHR